MKRDTIILCAVVAAISGLGGMWLNASTTLVEPLEPVKADSIETIRGANGDVKQFLKSNGYIGEFAVVSATRDESLGRRYYRVRVGVENITPCRKAIASKWTWGRLNRAVYDNNVSARLPKSTNLPAWWRNLDKADSYRLMLDHSGTPQWYLTFSTTGDIGLMWTGK